MANQTAAVLLAQMMLVTAALLQVAAVLIAVRLVSQTGWNRAWVLLAVGFALQVVRRLMLLGPASGASDLLDGILSLLISVLLLLGLWILKPYIVASRQAQETLRETATQYRQTIDDLNESQRQLNTLLGNLPGMAYRCRNDQNWTMEFVSEGCLKLTGYPAEYLLNNRQISYNDLIHPDDQQMVWDRIQQAIFAQASFQITYRLLTADDQLKWVWEQGVAVRNEQGKIVALEGLIVDVTAQKLAEAGLQLEKEHYQATFEAIPSPALIWTMKADGQIVLSGLNAAGYEMLEGAADDWVGKPLDDLFPASARLVQQLKETIQSGEDQRVEAEYYLPVSQNPWRWAVIDSVMISGSEVLQIFTDLTDQKRAQAELERNEATLQSIIRTAPVGLGVVRDQSILWTNKQFEQLTGYTSTELQTLAVSVLFSNDMEFRRLYHVMQTQFDAQATGQTVIRLRRKDGTLISVLAGATGLGSNPFEDGVVFSVLDITELEQSRRALEASETRYRLLAENVTDVIWTIGLDGRFTYVSPSVEQLRGYKPEEIIGQSMTEALTPESMAVAAQHWAEFQDYISEGRPYDGINRFELEQPCKDGSTVWTEVLTSIIYDEQGSFLGLLGLSRDITERRLMESALRQQMSLTEKILDTMQDGYILFDENGNVMDVNDAYSAMIGYSRHELLRMRIADLEVIQTSDEILQSIQGVLQEGNWRFETRHRHQDGHMVDIEVSITALNWLEEPLLAAFLRDITESKKLASQLARDRNLLRVLIDALPDLVYVKDTEGRFLTANNAVAEVMRAGSSANLLGKTDFDFYPPDVAEAFSEPERILLETGQPLLNLEEYYFTPSGEKRWLLTSKIPLRDREGNITGLVGVGRDITENRALLLAERDQRVWAETLRDTAIVLSQLIELDAVLDVLLENIERVVPHDGADIRLTEDGVARVVRSRGYDALGSLQPKMLALETEKFPNLREMSETGRPIRIGDIHHDPRWVLLNMDEPMHGYLGMPIKWEDDVIGFITVLSKTPDLYTDVHEERLAVLAAEAAVAIQNARLFEQVQSYASLLEELVSERTEALRASEARYRAIVEDQLEMVIRYTPDGVLTFANEAYCRFAGADARDLLGGNVLEMPLFRDRVELPTYLQTLGAEAPISVIEQEYAAEDKSTAWMQWTDRVIVTDEGQVLEYQSVGRDVTQLKLLETQLRQALEREISVGAMRSRFLSMAAHDLRNPLAAVKTTIDLLRRYRSKLSEEKTIARLDSADASIRSMVGMLDDILTIGRVESGRLDFEPELVELEPFCWRVVDEIAGATGAYNIIRVQYDVPHSALFLDERLLRHILSNLLSNAVKYSPDGTPVDFRISSNRNTLFFAIQDYGIGIPEEEQHLVFEFFHRFSNVGAIPGTGLGLAIVKRAADIHGGTVSFESLEHVGTTFHVQIPLIMPDEMHFNASDTVEIELDVD